MTDSTASRRRHPSTDRKRRALRVIGSPPAKATDPDSNPAAVQLTERAYGSHLDRSPLSASTRAAYRRHVRAYLAWLSQRGDVLDALRDPHGRDFAVRDYRSSLKDRRLKPATVNAALAAIDHLYGFLRLGRPDVRREPLPALAPRALSDAELRSVLRAAERRERPRDRAIVALMAFAGLRLAEVADLDVEDVAISARKGLVTVRRGKGDVGRTVPLSSEARSCIEPWLRERPDISEPALFVNPAGGRLSPRALDRTVRRVSEAAGLQLSAHVLRHTFVTRMVRAGVDVVLVAELAGHRSLETTRRYALPTAADREAAVELAATEPQEIDPDERKGSGT